MKLRAAIFLPLVLSLVSCTVSEMDPVNEPDQRISFLVASYQSGTKSDNVLDYDTNVPFATYGWFYNEGQSYPLDADESQPFMVDEKISHFNVTANSCQWLPATTYYWPKAGTVDFISYSPATASKEVKITQDHISFNGFEIDQSKNLMYADKAAGMRKNLDTYAHTGVPTLFHHALSQLNFTVRQSLMTDEPEGKVDEDGYTTWTIAVSKIQIKDLAGSGSLELTLSENQKQWILPKEEVAKKYYHIWKPGVKKDSKEWNNPTEVTRYKDGTHPDGYTINGQVLSNNPVVFNNGKTGKDLVAACNYLVIPQYLDNQEISVTYSIITRLPNGSIFVQKDITTNCKAKVLEDHESKINALDAWEINKNITYELNINPVNSMDPISFDPAVQSWDECQPESVINY